VHKTGWFGVRRRGLGRRAKIDFGRVCIRVATEAPIDVTVIVIDIAKRGHFLFAPLDIETSIFSTVKPIAAD
jgi:hypothetical protein